jgi:hypothetical protein
MNSDLNENLIINADLAGESTAANRPAKKKKKKVKKPKKDTLQEEVAPIAEALLNDDIPDILPEVPLSQSVIMEEVKDETFKPADVDLSKSDFVKPNQVSDEAFETKSDNNSDFSTGSDSSKSSSDPGANLLTRTDLGRFGLHLSLLLHKTILTFMRNIKQPLIIIFCPIFWCALISFINSQQFVLKDQELKEGTTKFYGLIPPCFGKDCVTLGYSVIGDSSPEAQEQYEWIDEIMKSVSASNDLVF